MYSILAKLAETARSPNPLIYTAEFCIVLAFFPAVALAAHMANKSTLLTRTAKRMVEIYPRLFHGPSFSWFYLSVD